MIAFSSTVVTSKLDRPAAAPRVKVVPSPEGARNFRFPRMPAHFALTL